MSHRPLLGGDMDRLSDKQLETLIRWEKSHPQSPATLSALTELRDRRAVEKIIGEWDNYERNGPR